MALVILLLLLLLRLNMVMSSSPSQQPPNPADIDRIVRDSAFRSYPTRHARTARLYNVSLPPSLSGVAADIARFRSGSLRRHGAEIEEFYIPPGLVVHPRTKRIVAVRQNLGGRSSIYGGLLNASGFQLLSPVVGIRIYDAALLGNSSERPPELGILVTRRPIVVDFSRAVGSSPESGSRCAVLGLDGTIRSVSNRVSPTRCAVRRQGHFALVVVPPAPAQRNGSCSGKRESMNASGWKVVVAGAVAGAFGVGLLGLVAVAVVRVKRKRWEVAEMERRAHEEAALQISMVGHLRAPVASGARTAPALEEDYDQSM